METGGGSIIFMQGKNGGAHKFMHAYQGALLYKDGFFNNRNAHFEQRQSIDVLISN